MHVYVVEPPAVEIMCVSLMATAAHDFLLYVENQINAYEKSVYVLFFVASSLTKRCYNDVIEGRAEDETNDRYESK